jgi:pimeloyl-ACP methyl ester carboxylesterase
MSIGFALDSRLRTTADDQGFRFSDVGSGSTPVVLLHGHFGGPSNWHPIMAELAEHYRFLALQLPIDLAENRRHTAFKSLGQLTDYVAGFFEEVGLEHAVLCGNSLGGQVALDFHARFPERVDKLVLSGSAGLFERNLASGRSPRVCREFIREQACEIFFDPVHVTEELIDGMYEMLGDRRYRRFLLRVAKASRDRHMLEELSTVGAPTLLIWGRNDTITPPSVAEEFCDNIPQAELAFIDRCGHSPPIEQPGEFARLLHSFLSETASEPSRVLCKPR